MESEKNLRLPLSDDRNQRDERQRKVSAMTRRGVFAALSYMASSGSFLYNLFFIIFDNRIDETI